MAASVAAGGNGVCSTDAERISVAKTQRRFGGAAIPDSAVKSVTKGLRTAYPGVECNITNV
jgi:hypothetical protein